MPPKITGDTTGGGWAVPAGLPPARQWRRRSGPAAWRQASSRRASSAAGRATRQSDHDNRADRMPQEIARRTGLTADQRPAAPPVPAVVNIRCPVRPGFPG